MAAALPPDLDLVAVVTHAERLRQSKSGPGLEAITAALLSPDGAARKWSIFARSIGLSEEQAFDALFGSRMIVVASDLWGENPRWALLTDVSRETEIRLRKTLAAAPRGLVSGKAVYAVENGRFEMTMQPGPRSTRLLMTRAADRELFDRLAADLGRRPDRGAPDERMEALAEIERRTGRQDPDVLIALRLPQPVGGWAGALMWENKGGVLASIVARTAAPEAAPPAMHPKVWETLSRGALLAIVERRPAKVAGANHDAPAILRNLPFLVPDESVDAALGETVALSVRRDAQGVGVTAALRTIEPSRAAVTLDDAVSDLLVGVSGAIGVGAWDYNFGGAFPEARREVTLSGPGGPGLPILGPGFTLTWTYRADPVQADRGWLAMCTRRDALAPIADALCEPPPPGAPAWLTQGLVRPAEIRELLARAGGPLPPPVEALRWIDEVGWRVNPGPDGFLWGEAGLVFREQP